MADQTHGEKVKALILTCGIKLWRSDPATVSARRIGKMMDMTHSAILYHYGSADGLRMALATYAVETGDTVIVPQLIAARHPAAASLSDGERRRYLDGC